MVTTSVTMSSFEDLPIAQTLAKMSLKATSPEDSVSSKEEEEKKDYSKETSRVEVKVGVKIPVSSVPRRSILKVADQSRSETQTAAQTSTGRKRREVSFNSIEIRHYQMTLGDNPACSIGAPVQLAWEWDDEERHDLDIYEVERRPRRKLRHLVLSYYRRKDILMAAGFDENHQKSVERQIGKLKRQRKTTGFFLPMQKMEEAMQSAGRKVRRVRTGKKKDSP